MWWKSQAMGSHPEMSVEGAHNTGSAVFFGSMLSLSMNYDSCTGGIEKLVFCNRRVAEWYSRVSFGKYDEAEQNTTW